MIDLLAPRYLVIADYPYSEFEVGKVLNLHYEKNNGWYYSYAVHDGMEGETQAFFQEFQNIFRKLEWWEYRSVENLPKYVKHKDGTVYKVKQWFIESDDDTWFSIEGDDIGFSMPNISIATKEEYNQYQLKQNSPLK